MKALRLFAALLLIPWFAQAGTHSSSGGGGGDWSDLTGIPAGFADGDDAVGGSVPSTGAGDPVDGVTACGTINELYLNITDCRTFRCLDDVADTWAPAGVAADSSCLTFGDAAVDGTLERDEVIPEWTIINADNLTAAQLQAAWYAALEPIMDAASESAANAQKVAVRVIGTFDGGGDGECDFGDATDWDPGSATGRSCLAVFRSGDYSGGLPTIHGGNPQCTGAGTPNACCSGVDTGTCDADFILDPGALTIDISRLKIVIDGTGQTEPMFGMMYGSGMYSGHPDGSSVTQFGWLANFRVIGPPQISFKSDVDTDWSDADAVASMQWQSAGYSSTTSSVGVFGNGNPNLFLNGVADCRSQTISDIDDWCYMGYQNYSSHMTWLAASGVQCMNLGASSNLDIHQVECTGVSIGANTPPFGIVLGDQNSLLVPVSPTCASGFCTPRANGAGFGRPTFSNPIIQNYRSGNIVTFHGRQAIFEAPYIESAAGDDYEMILGSGYCSSDTAGGTCTLNSDCGAGTCAKVTGNCESPVILDGLFLTGTSLSPLGFGPCAISPFAAGNTSRDAIVISGQISQSVPAVSVAGITGTSGDVADAPVDLSQLQTETPLAWPATYAGLFFPQGSTIYSTDCTVESGQFRQDCIDTDATPAALYKCLAPTGGTSNDLCDEADDWVLVGDGGGAGDISDVGSLPGPGAVFVDGTNGILTFEGSTNDTVESTLSAEDPTVADQAYRLPNNAASGTYDLVATQLGSTTDGRLTVFSGTTGTKVADVPITADSSGNLNIPATGQINVAQGATGQCMQLFEASGSGTEKIEMCAANTLTSPVSMTSDASGRFLATDLTRFAATNRVACRDNPAGAGQAEECTPSAVLDMLGTPADGDVLVRSGGVWTLLPIGSDGQVLKLASGLPGWGTDVSAGSPTLNDIGDPTAAKTITFDAGETATWAYTGNYTTGSQFLVQQLTGNPTGGILLEARAGDTDTQAARFGDGTNYVNFSKSGNQTFAGTATLTVGTLLGTVDAGGATSFEVPNGNDPTLSIQGQVAVDGNDQNLRIRGASATRVVPTVQFATITIFDPDTIQATSDALPILPVESTWAPGGITILDIYLKTDASSTYSINMEEWTSPTDGAPSTIETVATSASTEAEDDGTLTDAAIAAGSIVFVDLPATAANWITVSFTYTINTNN